MVNGCVRDFISSEISFPAMVASSMDAFQFSKKVDGDELLICAATVTTTCCYLCCVAIDFFNLDTNQQWLCCDMASVVARIWTSHDHSCVLLSMSNALHELKRRSIRSRNHWLCTRFATHIFLSLLVDLLLQQSITKKSIALSMVELL